MRLSSDGETGIGLDDALVDPSSLKMTRQAPLFSSDGTPGGDPAVDLQANPEALSLAWPSRLGYSDIIFALPQRSGTYDFNQLAARQVLADVGASLAARSWYLPSKKFSTLYSDAKREYLQAQRTKSAARQGALFAQSLDAGTSAEMQLLTEAGIAYASTHRDTIEWGATFDTIAGGTRDLRTARDLYPKDGWLRICFDPGERPQYYTAEIDRAHELGLRVVGQILDSSEMRRWSVDAFERRTREYVDALPGVDEWETGNEVNGSWLGSISSVVAKTAFASKYVKEHTRARVLVTLYWELGEGRPENALFNWAAEHMTSFVADVDDVGISLYPRQNPMGEPFDRVVSLVHAAFPRARVVITELDYDRGKGWWWGSRDSISPKGRDAVAATYQSAIVGYPYSGGGTFWWYFVEEVNRGNPLYRTLQAVYRSSL